MTRFPLSHCLIGLVAFSGCSAIQLASYAVAPSYPRLKDNQAIRASALKQPVDVRQSTDGLWHISSSNEVDAAFALGYLQAFDRLGQLDILRKTALGELSVLLGNVQMGRKSSLETDIFNRSLQFREQANELWQNASLPTRAVLQSFVSGINRFIDEGHLPLEHRLLGVTQVEPWTVEHSLAVYSFMMFGLSTNHDVELRRLMIACQTDIQTMERIWPSHWWASGSFIMQPAEWPAFRRELPPDVVPELAGDIAALCQKPRQPVKRFAGTSALQGMAWLETLQNGISTSNNWVVSGKHTQSGKVVFSTDPHMPHMNPPLFWGAEVAYPEHRSAGFALIGTPYFSFGLNGKVAWGVTNNHVDRQDVVLIRAHGDSEYEFDGRRLPFVTRQETFFIRGQKPVTHHIRYNRDGVVLNDVDPFLAQHLPLVALRMKVAGQYTDLNGFRQLHQAKDVFEVRASLLQLKRGSLNWVFGDDAGNIGFQSTTNIPIRQGYSGAFPIPGWLPQYDWQGAVEAVELPSRINPERGWLGTMNQAVLPPDRFPTALAADPAPPQRFDRFVEMLSPTLFPASRFSQDTTQAMLMDVKTSLWPAALTSHASFCSSKDNTSAEVEEARQTLCAWNGHATPDSAGATLFVLLSNALMDLSVLDDWPNAQGSDAEIWQYVQATTKFEGSFHRLWTDKETSDIFDVRQTPKKETRADILEMALVDAVSEGMAKWGKSPKNWAWGKVRAFQLKHAFASRGGPLGWLANSPSLPGRGLNETLFKNQHTPSDRLNFEAVVGPVIRLSVDFESPWNARYTFAGGNNGWPKNTHYGNLVVDWMEGRTLPLTPAPSSGDTQLRFMPQ